MRRIAPIFARARRGLSLVDTMIGLAITGLLLAGVAVSYSASSSAVRNNDEFFQASNAARISILQVMTEVRRCQALQVYSDHIDIITADNHDRTYRYVAGTGSTGRLVLIDNADPDPSTATHTLASNIAGAQFSADSKTVTMNVTVDVGNNQVTLCGSATQRRLVTYDED